MIFLFLAKSLPNQKNVAIGRAGTLKMEAGATQNGPQDVKMLPGCSKMRPKSAKMGPQSVPMAAQMSHGSPTCCREANFGAPGGLWD